jgi:hypothetical protein
MRMRTMTMDDVQAIAASPWDITRHEFGQFGYDFDDQEDIETLKLSMSRLAMLGRGLTIEDDGGVIACPLLFHVANHHKDGDWSMWFIGGERLPVVAKPLIKRMKKWLIEQAAELGVHRFVCETKEEGAGKWFAVLGFQPAGRGDGTWRYIWTRRH